MKKSHIILATIFVIIFLTIGVLYIVSLNMKKVQQQPGGQNNSQPYQSLPVEPTPAGTPQGNTSGYSPIGQPRENLLEVQESNSPDEIKNSYEKYVKENFKLQPYYEKDGISDAFAPSDKDKNLIPIATFFSAIGANINPKIKSIMEDNYYGLFYCIDANKQKEYGIAFDLSDKDSTKAQSNSQNAKDAMLNWEPFMLKDLHSILFPSTDLDTKSLNQALTFKDGQFRYAELTFPNGKSSINYRVTDDPLHMIFITTSPDCLIKVDGYFSALD